METNMNIRFIKKISGSAITATIIIHTAIANAANLDDGAILAIYNQVNTFDIETAGLGLRCGQSAQVTKLAKMVQTDHTGVRQMAVDLANKMNVPRSLPAGRAAAAADHAKALGKLMEQCGKDFDRAYLAHEIAFHKAAIDAVNTVLIPSAKNAELVALMKKILPGFEHHLAETRRVARELGY